MHKNYQIKIPDGKRFINQLNTQAFIKIDGANLYEPGYECKPFIEFEKPQNFPDCCKYHSSTKENLDSWFLGFPNCCNRHKKIAKKEWFRKENYDNLSGKILKHILYTENFIEKSLDKDDWYKEITDYIQYNIDSFGIPSIGANPYYFSIKNWIKNIKPENFEFPKWKKTKLIEFLENFENPVDKTTTDLNILLSIFQRWLKTLPSLPFFIEYKNKMKGKFPVEYFLHKPEYNRFTRETKFKSRTKRELIELLILITKESLKSINTPELLENKTITDKEKYEIDLLSQEHILEQNKLLEDYSKKEIKYFKIIRKWMSNEKKHIKKLKPLLNSFEKNNKTMNKEVFITYSWDDEKHKDKVLALNNYLRENGFNSEMDRSKSDNETSLDFRKMMHSIVIDYSKIIIVLSKGYKVKANDFKGGVGIEYEMIIKDFEKSQNKYILVSFCDITDEIIPVFFREKNILDLRNEKNRNELFSKLKNENVIDFSEVADNKPNIKKKKIENFNDLMNKK